MGRRQWLLPLSAALAAEASRRRPGPRPARTTHGRCRFCCRCLVRAQCDGIVVLARDSRSTAAPPLSLQSIDITPFTHTSPRHSELANFLLQRGCGPSDENHRRVRCPVVFTGRPTCPARGRAAGSGAHTGAEPGRRHRGRVRRRRRDYPPAGHYQRRWGSHDAHPDARTRGERRHVADSYGPNGQGGQSTARGNQHRPHPEAPGDTGPVPANDLTPIP